MRLDTVEKRAAARAAMIPPDAQRDPRSTERAEVWLYGDTKPCARAFIGTSAHPAWHYRFNSEDAREHHIKEFFERRKAHEDIMTARKTQRVTYCHTLKIGDIVHTSWGYDQTNVSFYEVTRIVSDRSVGVRKISQQTTETGIMCGHTVPCKGEFVSEEKIHRVRQGNVIVNVEHGHYDGYPCGADTVQRCSWYA